MHAAIQTIEQDFEQALRQAQTRADIEAVRVGFLGRKGRVAELFSQLSALPDADKPLAGKLVNELKNRLHDQLALADARVSDQEAGRRTESSHLDITLPGIRQRRGTCHPLSIVIEEICALFVEMGFKVVEGPEIETEYYNFEALNIPLEHPSRESFDTFYVQGVHLLRSHTSPVQVRVLEKEKPPIQIVVPGRVYRPDATDASHSFMFHQIEGLLIDEGISFAHLKSVLSVFAKKLFGSQTSIRFRPHFFPFTEPSAEVDVSCIICRGKGCRVCKQSGWLEVLGSGMVHPQVLAAGNIDPEKYSGFAFGMGVERIAMLKYGVDDIRLFFENDTRFIRQFS